MWHWFLHVTGSDNTSGVWYGFWSGFGSDLGEIAIIGGIYRVVNCHVDGCKRVGLHRLPDSPYRLCKKHHPVPKITHAHILEHHKKTQEKNNA